MNLSLLQILNLQNNNLQTVDPDWFFTLQNLAELRLESNSIPPGAFQHLNDLDDLALSGNFQFLDGDTFWGTKSVPSILRVVGGRLGFVRTMVVHERAWSLLVHNHKTDRESPHIRRQDVSLRVSRYLLCFTHDPFNHEQTLTWKYNEYAYYDPRSVAMQDTSCGMPNNLLTTINSHANILVLLKTGYSDQYTPSDDTARCRQGWEHNSGLAVVLKGGLRIRFTSILEGNETKALTFTLAQSTSTSGSATDGNLNTFSQTNVRNITCFVLANGKTSRMVHNVSEENEIRYNKTCPDSGQKTPVPKNQTQLVQTTSPAFTRQACTVLSRPTHQDISIYAASPLVPLLGLCLALAAAMLKKFVIFKCKEDRCRIAPRAKPGRARSSSLPAISYPHDVSHRQLASCRSLPTNLSSIEPSYCEIPDDTDHALHTYWEIPDGGMSDVTRSASCRKIPTITRTRLEDAVSCQSLPAALPTTEQTYCNIPDSAEDGEDAPLPYYAVAVDLTLPVVTGNEQGLGSIYLGNQPQNSRKTRHDRLRSHRVTFYGKLRDTHCYHGSLRKSLFHLRKTTIKNNAVYGRSKSHRVTMYGKAEDATNRQDMPADAKPPASNSQSTQGQLHQNVQLNDTALQTSQPNTYRPWQIVEGERYWSNSRRSASLPELLNRAKELQSKDDSTTPWRTSFDIPQTTYCPSGALLNYWPWKIERGPITLRRQASLPLLRSTPQNEVTSNQIQTNTYWPWEVAFNAHSNPLPLERPIPTVPNTYWPWEIANDSNPGLLKRTPLPSCDETLRSEAPPQINTYWPWEITAVGQFNAPDPEPMIPKVPNN
ncbi:hypothetical protein Bbelb_284260 [Branchiostoma belcheri]|nr:hypothetical protein Bbelb_284260 [Branchiostoma belcheri]